MGKRLLPLLLTGMALIATNALFAMPVAAATRTPASLPQNAVRALQPHLPAHALANMPGDSPVVRALRSAPVTAAPGTGETTRVDPCAASYLQVQAGTTSPISVTCAAYDAGSGQVVLTGSGLTQATWLEVNDIDNRYLPNVPFTASADGTQLTIDLRTAACSLAAGGSYTPLVVYLGTSGGYFALIGSHYSIDC